jgi:hypothetical protein
MNPEVHGCSWLHKGIYLSFEGYAMPCCKVKDMKRFSFGHIKEVPLDEITRKRSKLNGILISGTIPEECLGCGTAERIVSITGKTGE